MKIHKKMKEKSRLKLNSNSAGKFDIVFQGDLLTDDTAKLSSIRATSAGRRKNNEWKSKVFNKHAPKEPQFTKVKTSKTTQLRLSNKAALEQSRKGKQTHPQPQVEQQTQPDSNLEAVGITVPNSKHVNNVKPSHNSRNNKQPNNIKEESSLETIDENAGPRLESHKSASKNSAAAENPLERSNTFTRAQDENDDAGIISQKQLTALYNRLQGNDEVIEPERVPGLDLSTRPEPTSSSPSQTDISRQDEIRRKQRTPDVIYDPWGKPGSGAPTSDDKGRVRTHRNIKSLQNDQGKNIDNIKISPSNISTQSPRQQRKESPPVDHAKKTSPNPHARGQGKTKEELDEIEKKRLKHLEHQRAIAEQVEEKRRQKQLEKELKMREDQEAEERFQREQELLKQRIEEEDRKQREKEEAKLLQQKMLEESIRKAQEEALKAKEEARKSRMIINQDLTSQPGNGDQQVASPKYSRRKLHHEDEAIKPRQDFEEEFELSRYAMDEGESSSPLPTHTDAGESVHMNIPDDLDSAPPMEDSSPSKEKPTTPYLQKEKKGKTNKHNTADEMNTTYEKLKFSEENRRETRIVEKPKFSEENRRETRIVDKPKFSDENRRETRTVEKLPKFSDENRRDTRTKLDGFMDDYLVPFHRTKTEMLQTSYNDDDAETPPLSKESVSSPAESSPPPQRISKSKKRADKKLKKESSKEKTKKSHTNSPPARTTQSNNAPFVATPTDSPSSTRRQQLILEQLATLRQGLLQKEKECYQGTWSR